MAFAQGSLAQERTKMAFDPNKFLVALMVLSLLVATIFGMVW